MLKVGIIGASSQVGSSLAFYLKEFNRAEVVAFVRGSYSKPFFELLGITTEKIDTRDENKLKGQLQNFDVIVDCSFPSGQLFSILPEIKKNLNMLIPALQKNATFIYMSSIMAYGMPAENTYVENFIIARSPYAYIKRNAEKEVERLCRQNGIRGYNFRLSQVHGFLQSVNSSFREKLSNSPVANIKGDPGDFSNTIFINSIAEAILKCGEGGVRPGLYTLVSQPQWTQAELYSYYQQNYNIDCKLVFFNETNTLALGRRVFSKVIGLIKRYRSLLEIYILMRLPKMALKIKGRYRESEVLRLANERPARVAIDHNLLGIPPFDKIQGIDSSVERVHACETAMENLYNSAIRENRK